MVKDIFNYRNKIEDIILFSFEIQYKISIIKIYDIGIKIRFKVIVIEQKIKK